MLSFFSFVGAITLFTFTASVRYGQVARAAKSWYVRTEARTHLYTHILFGVVAVVLHTYAYAADMRHLSAYAAIVYTFLSIWTIYRSFHVREPDFLP